ERRIGLVQVGQVVVLQNREVAFVGVPDLVGGVEPFAKVVPTHVDKAGPAFYQAAGEKRAGAKQGSPVTVTGTVWFLFQIERRPNGGRRQEVEGELLPLGEIGQRRLAFRGPHLGVELPEEAAPRGQGVKGHAVAQVHARQERLPAD